MRKHPPCRSSHLLLAFALVGRLAGAQALTVAPLVRPTSELDELSRVSALLDSTAPSYSTLRAPSRQLRWSNRRFAFTILTPEITVGSNSALPYGFNDGPIWQGRGVNRQVMAGVALVAGPLRVIVAPQVVTSENLVYQTIPYRQDYSIARSVWANPFHPAPEGIDLPSRFGDRPLDAVGQGQSSAVLRLPYVELGASTENVLWGPGMQNAILWGSQGAGVPSAFLRTQYPLKTRTGTWDAWYTVGDVRESDFFDALPSNDHRTMDAIAVTWRPPRTMGIEFGLARMVLVSQKPELQSIGDVFLSVGRPNGPDSLNHGTSDQVTSLWARWAPPGAGLEAWAEWARFEEPASLRDLLESPGHSQGYTVGVHWARRTGRGSVRLWGEGTYLEPSPSLRLRPVGTTYVSRSVPQGFTVQGQPLGAGIGPGSSSQWLGADWIHPRWRLGTYAARVRWDNAAIWTPIIPQTKYEDVSLINGLRVAGEFFHLRLLLDWAHAVRLNYLFQSYNTELGGRTKGIDIVNNAVTVTLSTSWQRAGK